MEKLQEYLQTLLSTCSYELHLEPNRNPYLISAHGSTDISNTPMLGTQISMMIFPLIPSDVKRELPDKSEVRFVHPSNLGNFSFTVKKSPTGFNVTINPLMPETPCLEEMLENSVPPDQTEFNAPHVNTFFNQPTPLFATPPPEPLGAEFESSSINKKFEKAEEYRLDEQIVVEEKKPQDSFYGGGGTLDPNIVEVNDPQFTTEFSDTSTYMPEGRRDDFVVSRTNDFVQNFSNSYAVPTVQEHEAENYAAQSFAENSAALPTPTPAAPVEQFSQALPPVAAPPAQFYQPAQSFESEKVSAPQLNDNPQARTRMNDLFQKMAETGASDLHLSVSMPPMIRKDGKMQKLECSEGTISPERMRELLTSIMPEKNREEFERRRDSDFAYEIPGLARFRANIFADRKGMGGVFRIIPSKILTAEQLGLSKAIMDLCSLSKGLVVVTGPTGSGKSTTLCAMVDSINKSREDHIITIEDPIEFTHENQKCLVNQREVHNHTDSFKDALRAALREDPDILLVGEMRDLETISIAIETAETGHLVFGTLHTTTAASTIDRIIDQFPADRQQQIRVMLSESLKGVIAQTLLPKIGGGRVAALEVLIVTPAISNQIREGKTFQIPSAMQTGKQIGMVMLNDALFDLVQKGLVTPRDAYIKAVDKTTFESMLTRGGFKL